MKPDTPETSTDAQWQPVMRLRVLLPEETLVEEDVVKIVAEAENGSFCLLPRHVSFVAALVPGLLSFHTPDGESSTENYLAVDEGTLVKWGQRVQISTRNAVRGNNLSELRSVVEAQFMEMNEHERKVRSALARLEAGVLRRFVELGG